MKYMRKAFGKMKLKYRCAVLAIFLVTLILIALYALAGGYPFGDRIFLRSDAIHQYYPFLMELHHKVTNHESLFYSFSGGLGYNLWAMIAYYLASPVNLLVAFVTEEHVMEAMTCIMFAKLCFTGGIFAWYLDRYNEKRNYTPVLWGCIYALSAFFCGYYYNLMWFDSIMVLPLVMAGIEKIVRRKDGRLYCISLFWGLFCNYYVGYMLCLFSCIYFVMQLALCWEGKEETLRDVLRKSGIFAGYSLLSGGMGAVLLIPAYLALRQTQATNFTRFGLWEFYSDWISLISRQFSFTDAVVYSQGDQYVNLYCGCITLIFLMIYFLDSKRKIKNRIINGLLLIFLLFSINSRGMNIVWNGMHLPNGLVGRFTFLFILWCLLLAFQGLQHMERVSKRRILISVLLPVFLFIACCLNGLEDNELKKYFVTLILLFAYGILVWLIHSHSDFGKRKRLCILLCILVTAECIGYNYAAFEVRNAGMSRTYYIQDMAFYERLKTKLPDGFYRTDIDKQVITNESMMLGTNGLTLFSSTMQRSVTDFFQKMGMRGRTNKVLYVGATKLMSDVFGIRYLLSNEASESLYQMDRIDAEGSLTLYENTDALSLGFMVSDTILDWDIDKKSSFTARQSSLTEAATGISLAYKERERVSLEQGQVCELELEPDAQTYLEVTRDVETLTIRTPQYDKTYRGFTKGLYDLGGIIDEEAKAEIRFTPKENDTSPLELAVYICRNEDYEKVYQKLAGEQMEIISVKGNQVAGSIEASEDGTLFLSIPYDEGWQIKVDGQSRDAFVIGNTFMGIGLTAGTHRIEMQYIPRGFLAGAVISAISILLFCLILFFRGRSKEQ